MSDNEPWTHRPTVVDQAEIVLTATFVDRPELLDQVDLEHADFADERNALIFRTLQWMWENEKVITFLTVVDKLKKRIEKDYFVVACNTTYAQPWAVQEHVQIVREAAKRRRVLRAGQRLIELSQNSEKMDDDTLAEVEKAFSEIGASSAEANKGPQHIGDVMPAYMDELDKRYKRRGELVGVNTGFKQLNFYFGGWQKTDLCIVAARPSMGKTAFMLQTALTGAIDDVVIVFSIEMGTFSLADRLVSSESSVPLYNIRNGRIQDAEWPKLTDAVSRLGERTLYVDDSSKVTIPYIRAQVRKIAKKVGAGRKIVVFLDYLQLLKVSKGRSRNEEVGDISKELKAMAKELDCCMVALAQLSRGVEQRADKHPTLNDIRESGQIEQDADVIAFLYREEYYNPETEKKNVVEVIIGKNRNGPTGTAEIAFIKEYQKFVDLDREATK